MCRMASTIWNEAYKDLLPREQIDYMLDMFFTPEIIKIKLPGALRTGSLTQTAFWKFRHLSPAGRRFTVPEQDLPPGKGAGKRSFPCSHA